MAVCSNRADTNTIPGQCVPDLWLELTIY